MCHKLEDQLIDWLGSDAEQMLVLENNDEILLKRHGGAVLICVQLTSCRPDHAPLHCWLRLGAASLNHFQGSLAQAPDSGALWLVQCLRTDPHETSLLNSLEALLNQRDTWRSTVARLALPAHQSKPTSLRSLSY